MSSELSSYERTERLLLFWGPERMHAQASGQTFLITTEMQAHAEAFGYDRARADASAAEPPASNDETAAKPRRAR